MKHYLAERYDSGMKIGTVRLDAASIADAHRQAGYADPTRTYAVRNAVAGLARTNPQPPGQAKALTAAGLGSSAACTGNESVREEKRMSEKRVTVSVVQITQDTRDAGTMVREETYFCLPGADYNQICAALLAAKFKEFDTMLKALDTKLAEGCNE